nr:HWE histidine kinase domain-containing protein [uncultured Cohaesibacter sp.]
MPNEVDLTNCDREPIHLLGRIQKFGFLLATDKNWIVTHVSNNADTFCSIAPADLLGAPASQLLPPDTVHAIRNRLQMLRPHSNVELVYDVAIAESSDRFDVSVHLMDGHIVMEFEPAGSQNGLSTDVANVRSAINRMSDLDELKALYSHAVRFVNAITGFDRVMLYKFHPDDSGEVVAEVKRTNMESFLQLRYPASDIPKQARALYLKNPIRIIADVSDQGAPILASIDSKTDRQPLFDLSNSSLRSVSPIHLEYLRNMGVGASMSISIIVRGELWGLIACHHNSPHTPSMRERNSALLFGHMFSMVLETRLAAQEHENDECVAHLTAEISKTLSSYQNTPDLLRSSTESFAKILKADGYALVQDQDVSVGGTTPDHNDILEICSALNAKPGNEVFATHELSQFLESAKRYSAKASGLLSIPLSRLPSDYILFFRKELVQQVRWAGNPQKVVTYGPNGSRLQPRESFEAWQAEVKNTSARWLPQDLRTATQLRIMLLEVVLRLTDEAGRERKLATERQEILIAELNHRVRNILGLVRGLISQSNSGNQTAAEFVEKLDSRVHALALAHDQITQQNWSPASFKKLVNTEAESYLLEKKNRLIIKGEDVLLAPQAYASMALVIHEMITNSAKYGALSDTTGVVHMDLEVEIDNGLKILWTEKGGPKVTPPTRRGFGSVIVERTIPFELAGKTKIEYPPDGVIAEFSIPAQHIEIMQQPDPEPEEIIPAFEPEPQASLKLRSILVVEDNFIIAMEAEENFRTLGAAEISVVSTVEAGLEAIEAASRKFDFALLDINLGGNTSYEIGRRLKAEGIALAFASGYGEGVTLPDDLATYQIISKPYDKDAIARLLDLSRT